MLNEIVLKENEILEIRDNRIFKDMFNEHEMDTIEWLVMKILNCKYEDIHGKVRVGGIDSPNLSKDDKAKILDLVVYYKDLTIDIELNNNTGLEYTRNANYIANRVINSTLIGEDYNRKKQGILVNLNWYQSKEDMENIDNVVEIIWEYPSLKKDKPEYFIKFINVNLLKIQQICYTDVKEEELVWKLFTLKNKKELNDYVEKEKMLNNYQKKIERLSKDEEYCRMIWDERIDERLRNHDAYENGKDAGFYDGIEQGIKKNQDEVVVEMYKHNIDIETIAKCVKLSISKVEEIISDNISNKENIDNN